jgi:high-affinity Fe2+/Pb2+ permease
MRVSSITGIILGFLITAMAIGIFFFDSVRAGIEQRLGLSETGVYVIAFLFAGYGIFRLARSYNQLKRL